MLRHSLSLLHTQSWEMFRSNRQLLSTLVQQSVTLIYGIMRIVRLTIRAMNCKNSRYTLMHQYPARGFNKMRNNIPCPSMGRSMRRLALAQT